MNWFNDSDSEDESSKRKRPLETFHTFSNQNEKDKNDVEEELDPLDAYMNTLSSSKDDSHCKQIDDSENNTIGAGNIDRGRLDIENEEEVTSHWNVSTEKHEDTTSNDDIRKRKSEDSFLSSKSDTYTSRYDSIQAQIAMSSTFHKAGEKTSEKKTNTEHISSSKDTWDDMLDDYPQEQKLEIEPLERVDHNNKQYVPFRKKFLDDTNTHFGPSWRKENQVTCSINIDPIISFHEYSNNSSTSSSSTSTASSAHLSQHNIFAPEILTYLEKNNFKKATSVQAQSIPVALGGRDLIVTSHTGSGKTLAYLLPLVTHILDQPHIQPKVDGPISIILTPTRELAKQVYIISKKLLQVVGGKAIAVTGGMGSYEMSKELQKGAETVISTPGRLIDMVKKKATNFDRVTFVVLDEADKMLDMGFEKQVGSILDSVRPDRQTLMFSATFGKKVERVAKGWLKNPVRIAVGTTGTSSEHVQQHVIVLPSYNAKKIWLTEMIPVLAGVGKMIIFVASRATCESITTQIKDSPSIGGKGLSVDSIHGDRHQLDRNAALSSLRKGKLAALVATDVAARGLDVDDIETVINFDAAKNLDSHVHRIGRAGRLSRSRSENQHKKGIAYTLLTDKDADFAKVLMESFEREGREVSEELLKLAMRSKHFGGDGRQKWNKTGLGFGDVQSNNSESSYYGPSSKRKRWG